MNNNGIRIIKTSNVTPTLSSSYDYTHSYMHGYTLDLTRKTAVLMRQSRRGANEDNPESRLRQEGLVKVAVEIRGDHDPLMVLPCDEGSGVSGQKKIYERPKMLELWQAIQDGTVGSIIVAREDRLFRDRHLTQVAQFTDACAKHGVILIVAGRRCYDFRIRDDQKAFLNKMEQAYDYIEVHIGYMVQMKLQKQARGEWAGGALIAPYAMDRLAIQDARELRKTIKEFGSTEEDELSITRAFRPVIYEPWHDIAVDVFEKFKLFNFSRARLGRHIEERKCLFPLPPSVDMQRYLFNITMQLIPGHGYTFIGSHRLLDWMCNLTHLGYACIGRDEDGNRMYIEDAFDAAIPRDLFEPCYEAITGFTLDGEPSTTAPNRSRFVRRKLTDKKNDLLAQCFTSPDIPMGFQATAERTGVFYFGRIKRSGGGKGKRLSEWESNTLWTLPALHFDRAIVARLTELAEHDKELAGRVEKYYKELTDSKVSVKETILQEIVRLEALIAHYERRLNNPAVPLTTTQEARVLKEQADAERDLEKTRADLERYEKTQPNQFIPAYYRILGQAPGEFWGLSVDHQRRMLRLLIDEIQVKNVSPHLYKILVKWKDPVAQRWDCALLYKRNAVRSKQLSEQKWTEEENQLLRELWPAADKMDIYKALPTKSGSAILSRAKVLGIHRNFRYPTKCSDLHRALCYNDWKNTCAELEVDYESEEGQQVLKTLNYYAHTTEKKHLAFWWMLPVMQMNDLDGDLTRRLWEH